MTLADLQAEVGEWAERNFAPYPSYYPLLGLVEEVGELAGAHLKELEGIRGDAAFHEAKAKDAIGDVVIFLANYCNKGTTGLIPFGGSPVVIPRTGCHRVPEMS